MITEANGPRNARRRRARSGAPFGPAASQQSAASSSRVLLMNETDNSASASRGAPARPSKVEAIRDGSRPLATRPLDSPVQSGIIQSTRNESSVHQVYT